MREGEDMVELKRKKHTRIIKQFVLDEAQTQVVYHTTPVVTFNSRTVVLRTGGHYSVTVKSRMNQASSGFGLKFYVYQKNWEWYVDAWDGEKFTAMPFEEGMSIERYYG